MLQKVQHPQWSDKKLFNFLGVVKAVPAAQGGRIAGITGEKLLVVCGYLLDSVGKLLNGFLIEVLEPGNVDSVLADILRQCQILVQFPDVGIYIGDTGGLALVVDVSSLEHGMGVQRTVAACGHTHSAFCHQCLTEPGD